MSIVIVNHPVETFTPTQSGAIATHIFECCRAARLQNIEPVVITIDCDEEPYSDIKTILLEPPYIPKNGLVLKLLRAERRFTGWRHLRQRCHAANIARTIRDCGLQDQPMILHNDPETAVFLREQFPHAFLVHHFHNQISAAPRFRRRYALAVNATTGVSDFTSRWVEDAYELERNSVQTIYNGVDSDAFQPSICHHDGLPVINFVGRTGIEKAPDLLLKAAIQLTRKTREFRVQILGSNHWHKFEHDQYQVQLDQLSRELEQAGIELYRPGHVGRQDLPEALRKADIHVVPSRWEEPFALSLLEGMATGLATVASRAGGMPEVIGDAGFLFERNSVGNLTDCLLKLVCDANLRDQYGRKARMRAEDFTWTRTWEQFRGVVGI